jgi:hypothetical protein
MFGVTVLGALGLVVAGFGGSCLVWLHGMRKLSDVTGTVVAHDREWAGKGYWTYPVVEYTTRDGTLIRRTFRQLTRPRIGRKVRIIYHPDAPAGQTQSAASMGLTRDPMIYSVWVIAWLWVVTVAGLASLAGGIAFAVATV